MTLQRDEWPVVFVSLHIESSTPFLDLFFSFFARLDYPKQRMHVLVHNSVEHHRKHVDAFASEHASTYSSFQSITPELLVTSESARNLAL